MRLMATGQANHSQARNTCHGHRRAKRSNEYRRKVLDLGFFDLAVEIESARTPNVGIGSSVANDSSVDSVARHVSTDSDIDDANRHQPQPCPDFDDEDSLDSIPDGSELEDSGSDADLERQFSPQAA